MNLKLTLLSSLVFLAMISCKKEKIENESITPIANFSTEQEIAGSNLVKIKNNSIISSTAYLWNFGDGNTSTNSSEVLIHEYQSIGDYTITLIATSSTNNIVTATKEVSVTQIKINNNGSAVMLQSTNIGYGSFKANFTVGTNFGYFQISTSQSFSEYSESNKGDLLHWSDKNKDIKNLTPNKTYYMRIKNHDDSFSNVISVTTKDFAELVPTITITELSDSKKVRASANIDFSGEDFLNDTYVYEVAFDNQFSEMITTINTTTHESGTGEVYFKLPNYQYFVRVKGVVNGVKTAFSEPMSYSATDKIYSGLGNLENVVTANEANTLIVLGSNADSDYLEINLTNSPITVGEEFIFVTGSSSSSDNYIKRYKDNQVHTLHSNANGLKLKVLEVRNGEISAILLNGSDDSPYIPWNTSSGGVNTSGFFGLLFTTK